MVTIRLARAGAKKRPFFNVRVADSRRARDGAYLERVGYYNPVARGGEKRLELNMERIENWISLGAQPSERVQRLIKDFKLGAEGFAEVHSAKIEKKRISTEAAKEKRKQEALKATEQTSAEASAE